MDVQKIKEQLSRIKLYYSRNETIRALGVAVAGLKGIVKSSTPPPTELRSLLREGSQLLLHDALIQKYLPAPITYQPGQEKQLFTVLSETYKKIIEDQEKETYLKTRERKQSLDQAFNLGIKLLEQKKISEADKAFTEALTYYKDEERLFYLIAKALIKSHEPTRAFDYIKKGLTFHPTNNDLSKLYDIATRLKAGETSALDEL
ncbi:hypothetical protein K9U34_05595 [Lawsonia intracellularis]|uniref:Uncharacterized protein n=1 Tax=Lawsonia intracellularis (strain PHE/MN1-00) TaxID=363253 RepID=Q1MQT9_LAWIP|nr:hypothetical protein [Lawsonia intracellularis]AGC50002.1 hypothetical protein LAW_00603 [Lawsonia intracellularis N343]KAA0204700.1 hypothetical protein C4K43_03310 [Lawsonia intracellularis]MBZ3893065.1 hypothetical protein [Lawsonia intracellularis]OMQ04439.1 hypothetical protein BW722_03150 [Lawsonia intracellularis]RBN33387.1 hypothetical protein DR194_03065 [Lawsonia intracellularis]